MISLRQTIAFAERLVRTFNAGFSRLRNLLFCWPFRFITYSLDLCRKLGSKFLPFMQSCQLRHDFLGL